MSVLKKLKLSLKLCVKVQMNLMHLQLSYPLKHVITLKYTNTLANSVSTEIQQEGLKNSTSPPFKEKGSVN